MTFFGFAQTIFAYRLYLVCAPSDEKAVNGADLYTLTLPELTACKA
jgi:hypothetical protein